MGIVKIHTKYFSENANRNDVVEAEIDELDNYVVNEDTYLATFTKRSSCVDHDVNLAICAVFEKTCRLLSEIRALLAKFKVCIGVRGNLTHFPPPEKP